MKLALLSCKTLNGDINGSSNRSSNSMIWYFGRVWTKTKQEWFSQMNSSIISEECNAKEHCSYSLRLVCRSCWWFWTLSIGRDSSTPHFLLAWLTEHHSLIHWLRVSDRSRSTVVHRWSTMLELHTDDVHYQYLGRQRNQSSVNINWSRCSHHPCAVHLWLKPIDGTRRCSCRQQVPVSSVHGPRECRAEGRLLSALGRISGTDWYCSAWIQRCRLFDDRKLKEQHSV